MKIFCLFEDLMCSRKSIISKKPGTDVVLILYVLFALGVWDIGRKHFWVVVLNVCIAHCKTHTHTQINYHFCHEHITGARFLIEAKRPIEYDRSLQPSTDVAADSFG